MRKLLSVLCASIITSTVTTTAVSCSKKEIASLEAKKIGDKYEISTWDSSVINSDDFKDNYISNLSDSVTGKDKNTSDNTNINFLLMKNGKDKTNAVAYEIANYEFGSDHITDKAKGKSIDELYKYYVQQFDFEVFDKDNKSKAKWDQKEEKWNFTSDIEITKKDNSESKYKKPSPNVLDAYVAITPAKNSDYIGARVNVEKNDDMSKYYVGLDDNAKKEAASQWSDKNDFKASNALDYRYNIQFYFTID